VIAPPIGAQIIGGYLEDRTNSLRRLDRARVRRLCAAAEFLGRGAAENREARNGAMAWNRRSPYWLKPWEKRSMKKFLVLLVEDGSEPSEKEWQTVEARSSKEAAEQLAGYSLYGFGASEHLRAVVRQKDSKSDPDLFYEMPENA
jgi:hypothetical protein